LQLSECTNIADNKKYGPLKSKLNRRHRIEPSTRIDLRPILFYFQRVSKQLDNILYTNDEHR